MLEPCPVHKRKQESSICAAASHELKLQATNIYTPRDVSGGGHLHGFRVHLRVGSSVNGVKGGVRPTEPSRSAARRSATGGVTIARFSSSADDGRSLLATPASSLHVTCPSVKHKSHSHPLRVA